LNLKSPYRIFRNYFFDYLNSRHSNIKVFKSQIINTYNFKSIIKNSIKSHWLYRFINYRKYLNDSKSILSIFSVNGNRLAIKFNRSKYKIFYTIENVHERISPWNIYEDLLLDDKTVNLSLGFDYIKHEKYLRFPFWLMTTFNPEDNLESIKKKCDQINRHSININSRTNFCSFICRRDYFGDRIFFYNQINQIDNIDCDGQFMHNNDILKNQYNDNKVEFLKSYKFNLCPENSNYPGYVTEKIFDAISAGCIPIYWGSDNCPEPEILNHNAVLFIDLKKNNNSILQLIDSLNQNPHLHKEFAEQNRLTAEAPDIIYDYYIQLDRKLKEIIFKTYL